jgi:hypothetical protein
MSRKQAQSGVLALATSAAQWQLAGLTKQKQQANQHPNARYVSCKTTILRRNRPSIGNFSEVSQMAKNWDREKQLAKIKFCCTSIYIRSQKHVLNGRF